MAKNVLTYDFSEPLNGARTAAIDIQAGDGNLMIDRISDGEQALASGTLQYFEKQGLPLRNLVSNSGQASLTLRGGGKAQPWFHFPWAACNGATEWQIHLNPMVPSDITAQSDGGNVKLDLTGMFVTGVSADTGGGNVDVVLPDNAANLSAAARTGAGNVTVEIGRGLSGSNVINARSGAGGVFVRIPSEIAARIHTTTGLGKAIIDPRFSMTESNKYQSPGFDGAADKIEITISSGAGNVNVSTK